MAVAYAPGRLDFAHVRRLAGHRPEVTFLHSRAHGGDEVAELRGLRKRLRLDRYRCLVSLASGEYQLLQVEAPDVDGEELPEALRWQIKDLLHFPAETASIAAVDIPAAGIARAPQVWVAAADAAVLQPRVAAFDGAKLHLSAIDIPELAQRNLAALYEEENRGLALLCFDEQGGMLSFTFGGELYALRRIDAPLQQFLDAQGDAREALFERVALEAQRSLDNFDRQFGHISLSRLLVSPLPESTAFLDYLREYLAIPVAELDLAEAIDFPRVPDLELPLRQTQSLRVIGAALRDAPERTPT